MFGTSRGELQVLDARAGEALKEREPPRVEAVVQLALGQRVRAHPDDAARAGPRLVMEIGPNASRQDYQHHAASTTTFTRRRVRSADAMGNLIVTDFVTLDGGR